MSNRIVKGPGEEPEGSGPKPAGPISPGWPRRVIKSDVASAQEEARAIREAARAEAREIVERARIEAQSLRVQARDEGYEAGLARWTEAVLEAARSERSRRDRSRDDLIRLAVRIARKILGREISAGPDATRDLVAQAIRGLQHEGRIRIKLRPADLDLVREQRPRLVEEIGANVELELVADPSIDGGGCQVETAYGIVDARLETQLRVLEQALLETRG